jgi:hypothetical protein
MQFLHPQFLYGLFALSIPILIHLFNLRKYRKEYFTNVRFLAQIQLETKKRSRFRQILLLIVRCLAIASLVFAFAQPYRPSGLLQNQNPGSRAVTIYLDNSFSMQASGKDGSLMDIGRIRAEEIVSTFRSSDVFRLMTNENAPGQNEYFTKEELISKLRDIKITHTSVSLKGIIRRMAQVPDTKKNLARICFIISDFQKTTTTPDNLTTDTAAAYVLVPIPGSKRGNLYVDSVWFAGPVHRPGQTATLYVRLNNSGGNGTQTVPVKLVIDNVQKAVANISLEQDQTVTFTMPFTEDSSGDHLARINISDYPVTYDDVFYFSYSVPSSINVLNISGNEPDKYLDKAFSTDSVFRFSFLPSSQSGYNTFSGKKLVILTNVNKISSGLSEEMKAFVGQGGAIAIFPPASGIDPSLNGFLSSIGTSQYGDLIRTPLRVSGIDLEHPLFQDVFQKEASGRVTIGENSDLPTVTAFYNLSPGKTNPSIPVMKLQNGMPFMSALVYGKGNIYLFCTPNDLAFTNFPQHLTFLPVILKMAFLSEKGQELYLFIGRDKPNEIQSDSVNEKNMIRILRKDGRFDFIPEVRTAGRSVFVMVHGQITDAGWYDLFRGNSFISTISFNYDRRESDLRCYTATELDRDFRKSGLKKISILKPTGLPIRNQLHDLNSGFPLYKWLLILALIFLAAEIIIIRLTGK